MKCKNCGSREISWEIDGGHVVKTYNENGEEIDEDFVCNSLTSPLCNKCGRYGFEHEGIEK